MSLGSSKALNDLLKNIKSPLDGEKICKNNFKKFIIGCDEAGRGPIAGPVTAAAVILPDNFTDIAELSELNDSKKLTEKKREQLYPVIKKHALAWSIQEISAKEIDQINILQASLLAMYKASLEVLEQVSLDESSNDFYVLVDGNKLLPQLDSSKQDYVIKGDAKVASIAAASVLAKVNRDKVMLELSQLYPEYGLAKHKGYPTKAHVEAVREHGYSEIHRKSFQVKSLTQMELEL